MIKTWCYLYTKDSEILVEGWYSSAISGDQTGVDGHQSESGYYLLSKLQSCNINSIPQLTMLITTDFKSIHLVLHLFI